MTYPDSSAAKKATALATSAGTPRVGWRAFVIGTEIVVDGGMLA
ncbi:hypothetical protein Pmi06nite_74160 [Planotetraspora mira]|uniref:Uncharacterized protein n=1 Tax=Planotetraspora mira TaxID=58121 RepID=A0A8J3U0W0_9ACTN|nr:hypothetical protein Pmi06nite_74160 [Planotetraspora mira]